MRRVQVKTVISHCDCDHELKKKSCDYVCDYHQKSRQLQSGCSLTWVTVVFWLHSESQF